MTFGKFDYKTFQYDFPLTKLTFTFTDDWPMVPLMSDSLEEILFVLMKAILKQDKFIGGSYNSIEFNKGWCCKIQSPARSGSSQAFNSLKQWLFSMECRLGETSLQEVIRPSCYRAFSEIARKISTYICSF